MKKLGMFFCALLVVGLISVNSNARSQYRSALMNQIKDPPLRELQATIAKLGTSSKQCAHCHGKKKSERTPFGDKMALDLLEKGYVTKDEEKPNEYVYDKTKWTKDADGKYPDAALEVLKSAIEAALKK